jgi:hypothetical protein
MLSQITVDHAAQDVRYVREADERLVLEVARIYRGSSGQAVIARHDGDDRLVGDDLIRHAGPGLDPEKAEVDLATLQRIGDTGRIEAHHLEFDAQQVLAQHLGNAREPVHLLAVREADSKDRLLRTGGTSCCRDRLGRLAKRQAGMIEKGAAGGRQLDAARAADEELRTHLMLEIAQLPAERRLRGMKPLLGRDGETALLGDGDEVAEMAKLHS